MYPRTGKPRAVSFALLIAGFMVLHPLAWAQVDTEFWFAPPEVTNGHGDSPIFLRISTADLPSVVIISQPANSQFVPISRSIPANTTVTINLTAWVTSIETRPANLVRNTGLYISATSPVTVYYEVAATFNTDIFVLKGKNGLGSDFLIPGQRHYPNGDYSPVATSSFDIVATENNTVVTIIPTSDLIGHPKGERFVVRLNKGQTYSATDLSQSGMVSLAGSTIQSNKPIAVTLKEDSLQNNTCRDLIGDQLVPVQVTGSEYVIMKGFLQTEEFAFVTAIYDNTDVFKNGIQVTTIQRGEVYQILILDELTYLTTSDPSYVLHVTGFGCELGMAILPSLNCRGSTQIGFTRSTAEFFGLNILVPKEGTGNFTFNGSQSRIVASDFVPVPGTNDRWYAAKMSFSTGEVPVGMASLIGNQTHSFQIGIINGDAFSSCRFGYFSSFSTLFIGDDFAICENDERILDAGSDKDAYLWSTGETTQTIEVDQPGTYAVRTTRESCVLTDTLVVELDEGILDLGADVTICEGTQTNIDGGETNFSFRWSNGSTNRFLKTPTPGVYRLEVINYAGCYADDDVEVFTQPAHTVDLGGDRSKCPHETIVLNASVPGATYLWSTGETTSQIEVGDEGEYSVLVTSGVCTVEDRISVVHHPLVPSPDIVGSLSVCPNVTDVLYSVAAYDSLTYEWAIMGGQIIDQSDSSAIKVSWGSANENASLSLKVINDEGCYPPISTARVKINVQLEPPIPAGANPVCFNSRDGQLYGVVNTAGSAYAWDVTGGTIREGQGTATVSIDWHQEGLHQIRFIESSTTSTDICSGESPTLDVLVFRDSAAMNVAKVTAVHQPQNNDHLEMEWTIENPHRVEGSAWLRWNLATEPDFADSVDVEGLSTGYSFADPDFLIRRRQFQLSGMDYCGNRLSSPIHMNIVIDAEVDTANNELNLTWNSYTGWTPIEYRLWSKLNTQEQETVLATYFPTDPLTYSTQTTSALRHEYWVEAIGSAGEVSLSNKIILEFEHPIEVASVMTPNGDDKNDFFLIRNIHLYPENRLIVVNRWGQVVFETASYDNSWDGGDLSNGVYFYRLNLLALGKTYSGPLTVMGSAK